jgi:hypothetical protein
MMSILLQISLLALTAIYIALLNGHRQDGGVTPSTKELVNVRLLIIY